MKYDPFLTFWVICLKIFDKNSIIEPSILTQKRGFVGKSLDIIKFILIVKKV
jgi:hypothetical protein